MTNLIGEGQNQDYVFQIFIFNFHQTQVRNFLRLIVAEHVVLGIKFVIESVIPDVPDWVENAVKR